MSDFVDTMVTKYQTLLENHQGVSRVTVDGTTVTYEELHKMYEYWKRQQDRESGLRPITRQPDMTRFES